MNLNYCECAVKRADRKYKVIKYLWILSSIYLIFMNIVFLPRLTFSLVILLYVGALIIFWPNFSAEYEYVFCDGQIDFDIIRSGRKRKTLHKIDLVDAEIICGIYDDERLSKYNHKFVYTKSFLSGMNYKGAYCIILRQGAQFAKVSFEPDERMLNCIKNKKPRITFPIDYEE